MAKLHIDVTGGGGLGGNWYGYDDQTVPTPATDYLVEAGKLVGGFFNPYIRPGYLSPSNSVLTDCTFSGGSLSGLASSAIYDAVNDDYYFMDKTEVQIFQGDDLDDRVLTKVRGLGATGTPVGFDLEIYQINGVRKLFYVYEKSDILQVGIATMPFASNDDVWLTTTVSGAFSQTITSNYCFMRVADNSYAYLFADNAVHKIDGTSAGGTNGTITANVLLFPTYFRLTDAVDYRGNMFIVVHQSTLDVIGIAANGANFSTPCGVYIWNRQSTVISMQDYIPLTGVKAIKNIYVAPNGEIRIFTISSSGMTQIRRYTGSSFEVIQELGLGAAPMYPDSLSNTDLISVWGGTDGAIYAHGPIKRGGNDVLAKIGQTKVTGTSTPESTVTFGALLYGAANTYSGSSGYRTSRQGFTLACNNGSNIISKFYPFDLGTINSIGQYALAGNVYTPVIILPPLSKVNYIRVYQNAASITSGTTTAGTLTVYLNQATTANITSTITRNDLAQGYKYIPINQGAKDAVFGIQFKMVWPTDSILGDTTDWLPRMIEIDYEPLTKLK